MRDRTNGWLAIAFASTVCALVWAVVAPGTVTGPTFGFGGAALLCLVAVALHIVGHTGAERLSSEVWHHAGVTAVADDAGTRPRAMRGGRV